MRYHIQVTAEVEDGDVLDAAVKALRTATALVEDRRLAHAHQVPSVTVIATNLAMTTRWKLDHGETSWETNDHTKPADPAIRQVVRP